MSGMRRRGRPAVSARLGLAVAVGTLVAVLAGCSGSDSGADAPATSAGDGTTMPDATSSTTVDGAAAASTTSVASPGSVAPAAITLVVGSADTSTVVPLSSSFYEPPAPLGDGAPGEVLRLEKAELVPGGTVYRVLYRSRSLQEQPIVVSGLLAVPDGGPPPGGWPLVSWAHGTTGSADACAPSRLGPGQIPAVERLLARGWAVAATDYEGLGTPGPHPYLVGASQGRGVLDAARAALQVLGPRASGQVVAWGHSQGGQAAVWAGELAPTYAPELRLDGVAAVAPAVELSVRVAEVRDSPLTAGLVFAAVLGLAAADPALDPADVLTPVALEQRPVLEEGCIADVAVRMALFAGRVVQPTIPADWEAAARANDGGTVASPVPVGVWQGGRDVLVSAESTQRYVARACAAGTVVDYRFVADDDHGSAFTARVGDQLDWIAGRFAGRPVTGTC